mmetsp:Transcript_23042/g.34586  ORF Transcript_23042/g.34586 Transcript_23042/m.34586 type:complete len:281 (+) Transcript_23042:248-1090(+)
MKFFTCHFDLILNKIINCSRFFREKACRTIKLDCIVLHQLKLINKRIDSSIFALSIFISNGRQINWLTDNFIIAWNLTPINGPKKSAHIRPLFDLKLNFFQTISKLHMRHPIPRSTSFPPIAGACADARVRVYITLISSSLTLSALLFCTRSLIQHTNIDLCPRRFWHCLRRVWPFGYFAISARCDLKFDTSLINDHIIFIFKHGMPNLCTKAARIIFTAHLAALLLLRTRASRRFRCNYVINFRLRDNELERNSRGPIRVHPRNFPSHNFTVGINDWDS